MQVDFAQTTKVQRVKVIDKKVRNYISYFLFKNMWQLKEITVEIKKNHKEIFYWWTVMPSNNKQSQIHIQPKLISSNYAKKRKKK